jgi:hypothetical protein
LGIPAAASVVTERGGFDSGRTPQRKKKRAMSLNVSIPARDQGQAPQAGATGDLSMDSIRPNTPEPIPLRASPHRVGTIMIRFVGLLFLAVGAMALVYLR